MKTIYDGMCCNMDAIYCNILWYGSVVLDSPTWFSIVYDKVQTGKTKVSVEFLSITSLKHLSTQFS